MSSDDEGDHSSPDPNRPSSRSASVHTPSASRQHVVPQSTSRNTIPTPAGQRQFVQTALCFITINNARPVANALYAYHVQQSKNNAVVYKHADGSTVTGTGPEGIAAVLDRYGPPPKRSC